MTVIVPVLNEADTLPTLLAQLAGQRDVRLEVVVADGGSSDGTPEIARRGGARVVDAREANRGKQMNLAAAQAGGELLLFLHADSRLGQPSTLADAIETLARERRRGAEVAGHFALRFYDRGARGDDLRYRYLEEKTALNRPNTTNGDQGFLMSRELFERLGGFDASLPFLEDQRLAELLRRDYRWITLPGYLETSARRFETEGFGRTYTLMAIVMGCFDAEVERFFELAPEVYRHQSALGRLEMLPYIELIWRVLLDLGPRRSLEAWYRVGRFVRANAWQAFFLGDVIARARLGVRGYPLLAWYDRHLAPRLDHPVWDAAAAGLTFATIMGALAARYGIEERLLDRR